MEQCSGLDAKELFLLGPKNRQLTFEQAPAGDRLRLDAAYDSIDDPRAQPAQAEELVELFPTAANLVGQLIDCQIRCCKHQFLRFKCIGEHPDQVTINVLACAISIDPQFRFAEGPACRRWNEQWSGTFRSDTQRIGFEQNLDAIGSDGDCRDERPDSCLHLSNLAQLDGDKVSAREHGPQLASFFYA